MGHAEEDYGWGELEDFKRRETKVNGKIQAIGDKNLPKSRSFKIGDQWYGVWLQGKDGAPTALSWMASLAVGDILPEFEVEDSPDGKYHNIVSAKAPVISVTPKGEARRVTTEEQANGQRIGNCNTASVALVAAMIEAKLIVTADHAAIDAHLDLFYQAMIKRTAQG
jgi:hypothetical protein